MTTIKTPKGLFSAAIVLWLGGAVTGCGIGAADYSGFPSVGGGEFGATAGGVKDLALARELVKAGQVPPPEALLVEGAFSEHDLPLTGALVPSSCVCAGLWESLREPPMSLQALSRWRCLRLLIPLPLCARARR